MRSCCWLYHGDAFKEECICYELEIRGKFRDELRKEGTDTNRQMDAFCSESEKPQRACREVWFQRGLQFDRDGALDGSEDN